MDIVFNEVKEERILNTYVFECEINYDFTERALLDFQVSSENFIKTYAEFLIMFESSQIETNGITYDIYQDCKNELVGFDWLEALSGYENDDAYLTQYNIYYYNENGKKFTVNIPEIQKYINDFPNLFTNQEADETLPLIAEKFLEKFFLEQKIEKSLNSTKLSKL